MIYLSIKFPSALSTTVFIINLNRAFYYGYLKKKTKKQRLPIEHCYRIQGRLGEILKETHLTSVVVIHVYTRHMLTFTPSLLLLHVNPPGSNLRGANKSVSVKKNKNSVCFALASSVFSHT